MTWFGFYIYNFYYLQFTIKTCCFVGLKDDTGCVAEHVHNLLLKVLSTVKRTLTDAVFPNVLFLYLVPQFHDKAARGLPPIISHVRFKDLPVSIPPSGVCLIDNGKSGASKNLHFENRYLSRN